jgi:hypothetical protein
MTKANSSKKVVSKSKKVVPKVVESSQFKPLAKLTKKQMRYVESPLHHAFLTEFGLIPTEDNTYGDVDMEDNEIEYYVKKYGITVESNSRSNGYVEDTYIHYF